MYSKELEELIEGILADGVITENERAVLRKRAKDCGEDPDEVMIILDGRLAKQQKTNPVTEKRGNIVKCPNCGAPIEAGDVRCKECGYVFTNVKANNTAEKFAKDLEGRISIVKYAKDKEKVKEFIKNYPLPTGKEDMLEFIASMDARRRTKSDYQSAYGAKYKECITKAKVQFAGDAQIKALLSQTERFSFSKLTKTQLVCIIISLIICVYVAVCVIGLAYFWKVESEKDKVCRERYEILKPQIDQQYNDICETVNALPIPTKSNYDECVMAIKMITWKKISDSNTDGWDAESYELDVMDKASSKVNSYIDILHSIHQEYIDPWGNQTDLPSKNWSEKTGEYEIIEHTKNPKYVENINFCD